MDRRTFLSALTCGFLAAPLAAEAQPTGKVWRIGVLTFGGTTASMIGPNPKNAYVAVILRGLRKLGYVYGQHYVTEPRGAEGRPERFPDLVADLIRLQVDVIVAVAASLPAIKEATSTLPIIFPGSNDPVGAGYAKSLARPDGNFTGISFQSVELVGKRLELLKELAPAGPVAVLWDRTGQTGPPQWAAAEAAARERRWTLLSFPILDIGEVDSALRSATKARAGALLVTAGLALDAHPQQAVDVVAKHRLPAMYAQRFYVGRGGLACYAADLLEIWGATAVFIGKIFKGAKPGELPVEQPTKFELVINLKTAKALGLTIPPSLLQRADQVIE